MDFQRNFISSFERMSNTWISSLSILLYKIGRFHLNRETHAHSEQGVNLGLLKSWRALTLLTTDYNILAKDSSL